MGIAQSLDSSYHGLEEVTKVTPDKANNEGTAIENIVNT